MEGEQKDYDIPEKELEDYPDVFADIINALVCQGDEIVKPENLRSATVETRYMDLNGKLKRQTEDLAKYEVSGGEANVLFLLANQTASDGRMILRKCGYTGGYYRGQYNRQSEDVCPVVELVLYWGEKRWSGKRSIRSFFQKKNLPKGFWQQDNNAEAAHGTGKGACTMRNWLGEAWDKGIEQGKAEGKAEGIVQGLSKGIEATVSLCHEFGMTFEETAAKLKEKFDLADAEVERDMKRYW